MEKGKIMKVMVLTILKFIFF